MTKRKRSQTSSKPTTRRSERREQRLQQQRSQRNRRYALFGAAVVVGAVLLFMVLRSMGGAALAPEAVPDPVVGPDSAAVTVLEFSDFGCPSCRTWHNAGIQEAIVEKYGDQVQFVWKDFPVISAQSPLAAEAGQCAGAQDEFWAYHDYVYENSSGLGLGLSRDDLSRYAQAVGLDVAVFDACVDDGLMKAKVGANLQLAREYRLRGAPSFVVNGEVLPAPPSFAELDAIIQAALS